MRYQGKIINWKDEQGFGFVNPNGGGDQAFVHISAFARRTNRPVENDVITYELTTDEKGRLCAKNIQLVGEAAPTSVSRFLRMILTWLSLLGLTWLIIASQQAQLIAKLYLVVAIITFIVYAIDKAAARGERWRVPEKVLHAFALLCGWPGAMLAQKVLRHKSVKKEFRFVFWVTVSLNLAVLGWYVYG